MAVGEKFIKKILGFRQDIYGGPAHSALSFSRSPR
jgi:hypothetical protein